MRDLRTIRIFLSLLFLAAAVAALFMGRGVNPLVAGAEKVQIIPSALAMTMGATGFWLVATFMFGRIYCSTVCPVGTFQDSAIWLCLRLLRHHARRCRAGSRIAIRPFRYRKGGRLRFAVLFAYVACLLLGMTGVAAIVEPWNMMRGAARATNPDAASRLLLFSAHAAIGVAFAAAVLLAVWIAALWGGRRFCTEICPIGTMLGCVSRFSIYHIEIDPERCTSRMRCEEICKTQSIKVAGRYADNERCVRCFDCLKVCADDAINLQRTRNRRINPLMKKRLDGTEP